MATDKSRQKPSECSQYKGEGIKSIAKKRTGQTFHFTDAAGNYEWYSPFRLPSLMCSKHSQSLHFQRPRAHFNRTRRVLKRPGKGVGSPGGGGNCSSTQAFSSSHFPAISKCQWLIILSTCQSDSHPSGHSSPTPDSVPWDSLKAGQVLCPQCAHSRVGRQTCKQSERCR